MQVNMLKYQMTGILNNLNKMQISTAVGSETTSNDIATVRMTDMTYVVLPNFRDNSILSSKVIPVEYVITF